MLVPCCLDPRTDLALKLKARQEKVDPYDLKVLQLRELLETAAAGIEVRVSRDTSMRTSVAARVPRLLQGVRMH